MAESLEEPLYELVKSFEGFELRHYAPTIQARVRTSGRDSGASSGFRKVARYIFGGNLQQSSIAMTAPVSMWEDEESGWLAFTMPSAYSLETLPQPLDGEVSLDAQTEKYVAVASFSGRSSASKVARLEMKLRRALHSHQYQAIGPAVLAIYDNPWTTLPFLRRNELHIQVNAEKFS